MEEEVRSIVHFCDSAGFTTRSGLRPIARPNSHGATSRGSGMPDFHTSQEEETVQA